MSLDTNKRRFFTYPIPIPGFSIFPEPDGVIDKYDRRNVAGVYLTSYTSYLKDYSTYNRKFYPVNEPNWTTLVSDMKVLNFDVDFQDIFSCTDDVIGTSPFTLMAWIKMNSWSGTNTWTQKAGQVGSEIVVLSLVFLDGEIYGGTGSNGNLLRWDGSTSWTVVAPKIDDESSVLSLVVLNDEIYGGTGTNGNLLKWNGIDSWEVVAPMINDETSIYSLVVLNDEIYGSTYPNGNLLKWNGIDSWEVVAPIYNDEAGVYSLVVFNNEIYGGSLPNGNLLKWNGTNAWIQKAPKCGDEEFIYSLVVLNNEIYGSTYPNGQLLKWNGINMWEVVASKLGSETSVYSLVSMVSEIYGCTYPTGELVRWNGIDAWEVVAPMMTSEEFVLSLLVRGSDIYGSTGPNGNLIKWNRQDVSRIFTNDKIDLYINSRFERLAFTSDDSINTAYSDTNSLSLSTWKHIAITRDEHGIVNFYVNGELNGVLNQDSGTPIVGETSHIGNNANLDRGFDGMMSKLEIYDRVLGVSPFSGNHYIKDRYISTKYLYGL